jgi:hypothetical protein
MKKLKLSMITLMLATGFIYESQAQTQSKGLYLTSGDYLNHKLSYRTDPTNKNVIHIHEFIGQNNVTVISDGKKQSISKNDLFGYHDNNNDYRFYGSKAYQIIDTTGFYIYSFDKLVQQGKGPRPTRVYYFSKTPNTDVLPLAPENIAKAFPKNPRFRHMVEVASKTDIKLDTYDSQANEYKIKELYTESLR